MGDPANLSLGEMKLALQRWRTPQAEVDACLEKDDLIALYKRQRELSEARCVSLLWLLSPDGQVRLDGSIFSPFCCLRRSFRLLPLYLYISLPTRLPPSLSSSVYLAVKITRRRTREDENSCLGFTPGDSFSSFDVSTRTVVSALCTISFADHVRSLIFFPPPLQCTDTHFFSFYSSFRLACVCVSSFFRL